MEPVEIKNLEEFSLVSPETEKFWSNKNGLASKLKNIMASNNTTENPTIFLQSVAENNVKLVSADSNMLVNFVFNNQNSSVMTVGVFKGSTTHDTVAFSVISDGNKEFCVRYSRGHQTQEGANITSIGVEKYSHNEYYSIENSVITNQGVTVSATSTIGFTNGEDVYSQELVSTDVSEFPKSTLSTNLLKFRGIVQSGLSYENCYENGQLISNTRAYEISEICDNIARTTMFNLDNNAFMQSQDDQVQE